VPVVPVMPVAPIAPVVAVITAMVPVDVLSAVPTEVTMIGTVVEPLVTVLPAKWHVPDNRPMGMMAPVHIAVVAAVIADHMPDDSADHEGERFVIRSGAGRQRRAEPGREQAGAEQEGGCLDHVCFRVITGTSKVGSLH
jgi:hypothetical protein